MSSIKQIVREPDIFMFPAWNEHIAYYENSIVTFFDSEQNRNFIYMAKDSVVKGSKPNRDSNYWVEISYDSDHLSVRVDHLWNQNYAVLKGQIDSDVAAMADAIYFNVDSELRETRFEVNTSLVNFLAQSKKDLDSEVKIVRNDIDSDQLVQDAKLVDVEISIRSDMDSEFLVLHGIDSDHYKHFTWRIDNLNLGKDSDVGVINQSISNLRAEYEAEVLSSAKRFADVDSDFIKLNSFTNFHVSNTLGSLNARIQNNEDNNTALTEYVSEFVSTLSNNQETHTKIYRDIQSNRDRIIVLEDQIAGSIMDVVESNAEINRGYDSDIQSFVVKLNEQTSSDLSLFNDLSDLRTTVDKLKAYSGFDSDADLVDSDWVLRLITQEVQRNRVDSEWVMDQLPMGFDSDWVLRQIPTHVDSDWIINNTINIKNDSDALTVINVVKTNLDMGTF